MYPRQDTHKGGLLSPLWKGCDPSFAHMQPWINFSKGCFVPGLFEMCMVHVILQKKVKMWKVKKDNKTDVHVQIMIRNSFLHRIKLKDTNIRSFCRCETETIEHILWDCEIVQALLYDLVTFCMNKIHKHISFAKKIFILGSCVKKDTVKNLIALQIKYYIYSMRCLNNS